MTREEALSFMEKAIRNEEATLDPMELERVFVGIFGRPSTREERLQGLWSLLLEATRRASFRHSGGSDVTHEEALQFMRQATENEEATLDPRDLERVFEGLFGRRPTSDERKRGLWFMLWEAMQES